jgi:lysozyme family protein
MKTHFSFKQLLLAGIPLIFSFAIIAPDALAQSLSQDDQNSIYKDTVWYKPGASSVVNCSALSTGTISQTGSNQDYAGRTILNRTMLSAISQNQATYQAAAQQAGIPWQVLAAVHYRETSLSLTVPTGATAGDGQYQIVNENYPYTGDLTQQQFLEESIDAAKFLKGDGAGLSTQSDSAAIKDALGRYNGLPDLYKQQAINLGFSANQAYEGSPYVMNIADAKRDPAVAAPGTWLQYLTSSTTGPANNQYGAFVVYASLSGMNISGSCSSTIVNCNSGSNATSGLSSSRQNIVCVAQQELQKWTSGQLKPGTGYLQYSENRRENWCADFASWVYNQAGVALGPNQSPTNNWNVSYVPNLLAPPQDISKFTTHSVNGYRPQPGDLAIHGDRHVNIVVGVSGSTMTLIGGNQGADDFNQSSVTTYQTNFSDGGDITNFVSPN